MICNSLDNDNEITMIWIYDIFPIQNKIRRFIPQSIKNMFSLL